ncbi:MAG TPA: bifunctional demethylmenaquinone methyltransferase/2-methoxy-6-polyprenyl-1,4-benzoquinol methylase UbiE [candidate division Zixibacteria bacterium]|nr:bifunctional demethylmenaquinone methyltransferase/2-methoxy-6-polyprenyl-1,4-benzoquinol methylase UbiE [candidate division Zixibacteria bacterium]
MNERSSNTSSPDLTDRAEQRPEKIQAMFDRISPTYDLLNRLLTLGIDQRWRTRAIRALGEPNALRGASLLDLCCGTCDMTLRALRLTRGEIGRIDALDFSASMLKLAGEKVSQTPWAARVTLRQGDALALPYQDATFDCACVAFGIRNVSDVPRALSEVRRTLRPGGVFVVLEFSTPQSRLVRGIYNLYFRHVLPRAGALISGDGEAYGYLNQSAERFPSGAAFSQVLRRAGFIAVTATPLTFGLVTLYRAEAPATEHTTALATDEIR